jgi:hypothetical protein
MMGRQDSNQRQLFYLFNLEDRIPTDHLLRRINPIIVHARKPSDGNRGKLMESKKQRSFTK